MDDADYDRKVIETMTKAYWRHVAAQITNRTDPSKLAKLSERQVDKRRRARRAHVCIDPSLPNLTDSEAIPRSQIPVVKPFQSLRGDMVSRELLP